MILCAIPGVSVTARVSQRVITALHQLVVPPPSPFLWQYSPYEIASLTPLEDHGVGTSVRRMWIFCEICSYNNTKIAPRKLEIPCENYWRQGLTRKDALAHKFFIFLTLGIWKWGSFIRIATWAWIYPSLWNSASNFFMARIWQKALNLCLQKSTMPRVDEF